MSRIGYNQLSLKEQGVYEEFEKAFNGYASTIKDNGIDKGVDVMKVFQVVLGDNPQVIYFNKTQLRCTTSWLMGKQIHFCDAVSSVQIKNMNRELEEALQKAIAEIKLLNPITNYDKLICIYEYLQDNVIYDAKEIEGCCRTGKSIHPISHNAYGALVKKLAVCDGISSAFSLIAQKFGFECSMVAGKALFRSIDFSEHAWNIIKIGEHFYHMDATWDINNKEQLGEYSYEYFCISDDSIGYDHDWDMKTTPTCSYEDMSFYIKNACYANNLSQLDEIFMRYAKSKMRIVRVKIAKGIEIPKPENKYLGDRLINIASNIGRYSSVKYTWNKDIRCFYAKFDL